MCLEYKQILYFRDSFLQKATLLFVSPSVTKILLKSSEQRVHYEITK